MILNLSASLEEKEKATSQGLCDFLSGESNRRGCVREARACGLSPLRFALLPEFYERPGRR
jgi:hypothetical protein